MAKQLVRAVMALLLLIGGLLPAAAAQSYADITADRSAPERLPETFTVALDRSVTRLEAREWARRHYDAWLYPEITEEQSAEIDLLKQHVLDSLDL